MKKRMWVTYLIIIGLLDCSNLISGDFLWGIFSLVGLLGVYGYIFSESYFKPVMWSIYLVASLSTIVFKLAIDIPTSLVAGDTLFTGIILAIGVFINLPYYYAIYMYSKSRGLGNVQLA